jgi:Peptidase family M28
MEDDAALSLIRNLSEEIGPRRPCSPQEKVAAEHLHRWLAERGVAAALEPFEGYASFGLPYGLIFGTALAGGLVQRRGARLGDLLALAALAAGALEGDLRHTPVSDLLSRKPSVNVVGTVPAAGQTRQVVCLCGRLDTTRSGLLFHPAVVPHLERLLLIPAVSSATLALGPLVRRLPGARELHAAAIGGMLFALTMLAERELRGSDVPGANDNASGTAVAAQLTAECAANPLPHTEVRLLITSCEESGLLGAQAHARRHSSDGPETVFLNFDTVAADAPLTFILHEGSGAIRRDASPRLVELAERIATRRPELRLVPAPGTPGLPTDATVFRARGWEAITFLAQDGPIPHYHLPTDTYEHVASNSVGRALEIGREMLRELDRRSRQGRA